MKRSCDRSTPRNNNDVLTRRRYRSTRRTSSESYATSDATKRTIRKSSKLGRENRASFRASISTLVHFCPFLHLLPSFSFPLSHVRDTYTHAPPMHTYTHATFTDTASTVTIVCTLLAGYTCALARAQTMHTHLYTCYSSKSPFSNEPVVTEHTHVPVNPSLRFLHAHLPLPYPRDWPGRVLHACIRTACA